MVKCFGLIRGEEGLPHRRLEARAPQGPSSGEQTSRVQSGALSGARLWPRTVRARSAPVSPGPQIPDKVPEVQNKAQVRVAPANARHTLQKTELERETSNNLCLSGTFFGLGRSCCFWTGASWGLRAACLGWSGVGGLPGFPYFIPEISMFYSSGFQHEASGFDATSCCLNLRFLAW